MAEHLRSVPWWLLGLACLTLGLAPFRPEPHVVEKLRLLSHGDLTGVTDTFDLILHAAPWAALILRLAVAVPRRPRTDGP